MLRWSARLVLSSVLVCLCVRPAAAHPLGNFTINHLTRVSTSRATLSLDYTLDIAEIPTFQIMHGVYGAWDASQLHRWANEESSLVTAGLLVSVDGTPQVLSAIGPRATLRPGAGGLPTLYWTSSFNVPVSIGTSRIVKIEDRVYADRRIGWKDVVVAPAIDPTNRLTSYPSALIGSPRHNDVAEFTLERNGTISHANVRSDDFAPVQSGGVSLVRGSYLSDLFARPDQSPWLIALTLLVALGLGALHGLEPGHGKALLAFTLVGARATVKQAGVLALSLTFAHTIAVLLLGLALFFLADFASESIFGWITLVSGGAVAFIGARALNAAIAHAKHRHEHAHAIGGNAPLKFSSAVVAAMSGGIAPCPAAIVVLLTALRLHRVGYGLVLIVTFSLGLAVVLTVLGVAVVRGAAWIRDRSGFEGAMRCAPIVTASVISIAGAIMLAQGFVQQGIAESTPLVAVLTLAAIAGYSFVPRHVHA
jgi:ABC-type nickel/cobalt efflux system permease component RcnA